MLWGFCKTENRGAQELGPGNSVIGRLRTRKNFPPCASLGSPTFSLFSTSSYLLSKIALNLRPTSPLTSFVRFRVSRFPKSPCD